MNQQTRVGLFIIAATVAIIVSAIFLGNVRLFKRSARYFANFYNVEALPTKAAVKVAGVEIGKVARITLDNGMARIAMDIDPKVPIFENASAAIGSTGIIGTKFVELVPGTPDQKRLDAGSTVRAKEGRGLNEMIERLSSLFEDDDQYGNSMTNLKATIYNVRRVSEALNTAMGNHAREMEQIVLNVRDLTESAKVFMAHLQEISTEKKDDIKVAIEKIRGAGEKLDAILGRIQKGDGVVGALVSDDKAGNDVKEAVASIKDTANSAKKVLGRFNMINVYWNYRYRYDFRDEEGKSDVGLTFVPRPGKFYAFGVTNIGKMPSNEKTRFYERKNRITAVLGKDYGPFTGYAGAIRSSGGVGLNVRPLVWSPKWYRRFELNSEISDFSREQAVRGRLLDKPLLSAGAHIALNRWLWIGARGEDLLERGRFLAYTNIVFRDEDLAYFFGFASLAR